MNLFIRTNTAAPDKLPDAVGFASEIATYVTTETGTEVTAWSVVHGEPLGTISWSVLVESQAAMAELGDRLLADEKYLELVAGASELFVGLPQDRMSGLIASVGTETSGEYVNAISAQCAAGHIADAMTWGVDMMNHVASVTGLSVSFWRSLYGPWATVAWVSLAESAAQVDAAQEALAADPTYVERLDAGGALFQPGSATSRLSRRIA